jgi:predicted secreted hydrolase
MSVRIFLIWLCIISAAFGQGFAGLDEKVNGFSVPIAGKPLVFPDDHGPHADYRIEWWYVTANLHGANGADYGVQWTLFRTSLAPTSGSGWSTPQLWMGHAAFTSATQHFVAERLARGGIGQSGVTIAPFSAWIDNWQLAGIATPDTDAIENLDMTASGQDFSYALKLNAKRPVIPQGQEGYSVKSAQGQASYYYSQPFYNVAGTLNLPSGAVQVTGKAWLDHEWSSQPLAKDQTGWDWFSLHFDSGEKLMGFRLRDAGAGFTSATWISADGKPEAQNPGALKVTPLQTKTVLGHVLPMRWHVELPAHGIDVTTTALNPNAWMTTQIPYWEGPVRFIGSQKGEGYVEMTGYE